MCRGGVHGEEERVAAGELWGGEGGGGGVARGGGGEVARAAGSCNGGRGRDSLEGVRTSIVHCVRAAVREHMHIVGAKKKVPTLRTLLLLSSYWLATHSRYMYQGSSQACLEWCSRYGF